MYLSAVQGLYQSQTSETNLAGWENAVVMVKPCCVLQSFDRCFGFIVAYNLTVALIHCSKLLQKRRHTYCM